MHSAHHFECDNHDDYHDRHYHHLQDDHDDRDGNHDSKEHHVDKSFQVSKGSVGACMNSIETS